VSQYEHGTHLPSPQILQRIAFTLGFPVEFFVRPASAAGEADASPAFFRSLRAAPQIERDRASAHAWLVSRLAAAIERRVKLPACDVRLDLDLSAHASREEIEEAAATARKAWGVPAGPVANVVRLLESRGAIFSLFHEGDPRLYAFSQWYGGRPVVVLCADKEDRALSRWDAAHELGHLVLHTEPEAGNQRLEHQAHEFAAAFLLPAEEIRSHLPKERVDWTYMRELKKTWGVSLQALLFRARTIGLPERAYQRAMRYLSAQGWRLDEPVKLGPTERPTLLPKALELLERNGLPGETLAREAGLPERFLHSVLDRQHEEPPPFPSGVSRLGSVR
jgi:Zn-dependent peptidase ImmA (M78 family)/transcriptional regulator with XRE-family HTH domain